MKKKTWLNSVKIWNVG